MLTNTEKRELYKAMRSAHDGICPACGHLCGRPAGSEDDSCHSRQCDFVLKKHEIDEIRSWHGLFHKDLQKTLSKFRKENDNVRFRVVRTPGTDFSPHSESYLHAYSILNKANVTQCTVYARQFPGKYDTRNSKAKSVAYEICDAMNKHGV